jgi:hypothetical protein
MSFKLTTALTVALASLVFAAQDASASTSSAVSSAGQSRAAASGLTCVAATAANQVEPPPPIWAYGGGAAPSAAELNEAADTAPLCPKGQVPRASSEPETRALDLTAPPPTGEADGETENDSPGQSLGAPAVDPEHGECKPVKKGEETVNGCYWYVTNFISNEYMEKVKGENHKEKKDVVGMEYTTSIPAETLVSSFPGAHSIDQLAVLGKIVKKINEKGEEVEVPNDTVETGWTAEPETATEREEKDGAPGTHPHYFIFVNPDAYGGESCYDYKCDFISLETPKYAPGEKLPAQSEFKFGVKYLSTCFTGATSGCWWFWAGTQWVGYVPESAWHNEFTKGEEEQNYGEVFDEQTHPTTHMGDGEPGGSPDATTDTARQHLQAARRLLPPSCC